MNEMLTVIKHSLKNKKIGFNQLQKIRKTTNPLLNEKNLLSTNTPNNFFRFSDEPTPKQPSASSDISIYKAENYSFKLRQKFIPILNSAFMFSSSNNKSNWWMLLIALIAILSANTAQEIVLAENTNDPDILAEYLREMMLEGLPKIQTVEGKDIVLVIGDTGAGKSTLINHLLGVEMKKDKQGGQAVIVPKDEKKAYAKSGSNAESVTLHPEAYGNEEMGFYCDYPGFADNRGIPEKIWTSIGRELAARQAKSIKSIIIVIDYNALKTNRGEAFKNLSKTLNAVFSADNDDIAKSVLFAITKTESLADVVTREDIVELIRGTINAEKNNLEKHKNVDPMKKTIEKGYSYRQQLREGINSVVFGNSESEANENYKDAYNNLNSQDQKLHQDCQNGIKESNEILSMLELMNGNSENIVVVNLLNLNSKENILHRLKTLKPIPKSKLSFSKEGDDLRVQFDKRLIGIASEGSALFKTENHLQENKKATQGTIKMIEKEITVNERQIQQIKGQQSPETILAQKNEASKTMKENENSIEELNKKIKTIEGEISDLNIELKDIDTDDEISYWREEAKERRSWLGIFSYTKKEFKYPNENIPFLKVVETIGNGKLTRTVDNKDNGQYAATYESGYWSHADAEVEMFIKKKNHPANQERIKEINDIDLKNKKDIKDNLIANRKHLEKKNEELKKVISGAIQLQELEEILNTAQENKKEKKQTLTKLDNSINEISEKIDSQLNLYETAMKVISVLGVNFTIGDGLSNHLSNAFVKKGEKLMQMGNTNEAIIIYDKAIQLDKENANAYLKKGQCLDKKSSRNEADEFYKLASEHDKTGSLKKEIESTGRKQFELGYSSLNPYVYSQMSELAYYENEKDIKNNQSANSCYESLKQEGWKILTTSKNKNFSENGYIAIVFCHEETKQIVVAHCGTKLKDGKALTADLQLALRKEPDQFKNAAKPFVQSIFDEYGKDYTLSHTGHSLGGSLAALCAYHFQASATLFDPFGIKNIIICDKDKVNFNELPITNYLSQVNLINGSAPHVGFVVHLFPQQSENTGVDLSIAVATLILKHYYENWGKVADWLRQDICLHSISSIRKSFDQPQKLPRVLFFVESWPDNPLACLGFYNFIEELGMRNRAVDINSLTSKEDRNRLEAFGFQTTGFDLHKINMKYFDKRIQKVLKKHMDNPNEQPKYNIDSNILKDCQIEIDSISQEQYLTTSKITVIELKAYLENKVNSSKENKILNPYKSDFFQEKSKENPTENRGDLSSTEETTSENCLVM